MELSHTRIRAFPQRSCLHSICTAFFSLTAVSLFAITSPLFCLFAITSLGTALTLTTTRSRPGGLLPVILPLTGAAEFTSPRLALHAVSCFWIDSLLMLTPQMLYV